MTPQIYFAESREPRYSLLFALPLLVLYEGLSAALSGSHLAGVRNGADVLLKTLFVTVGGRGGLLAFGVAVVGIGGWFVWQDLRHAGTPLVPKTFGMMFVESIVYAAIFGRVVSWLTAMLLSGGTLVVAVQGPIETLPLGTQLVVSLGAGIYEELLFRVLIVGGLMLLFSRLEWRRSVSIGVAVGLSSLIFSTFHYVGPYGDQLTLASFTFRVVAGLLLSGLYVWRGFGITAWTHAVYDVGLALL